MVKEKKKNYFQIIKLKNTKIRNILLFFIKENQYIKQLETELKVEREKYQHMI